MVNFTLKFALTLSFGGDGSHSSRQPSAGKRRIWRPGGLGQAELLPSIKKYKYKLFVANQTLLHTITYIYFDENYFKQ